MTMKAVRTVCVLDGEPFVLEDTDVILVTTWEHPRTYITIMHAVSSVGKP